MPPLVYRMPSFHRYGAVRSSAKIMHCLSGVARHAVPAAYYCPLVIGRNIFLWVTTHLDHHLFHFALGTSLVRRDRTLFGQTSILSLSSLRRTLPNSHVVHVLQESPVPLPGHTTPVDQHNTERWGTSKPRVIW